MKVTPDDMRGIVGILPTPATPDAGHWSCTHSVALDETARMAGLVRGTGVRVILTMGTFGEGATLLLSEQRDFTRCLADVFAGDALLFAGATAMGTRETVARGRALVDSGADGLFLGRPMWLPLDGPSIVRFYADVAEALPGVPLVIYDNHLAFKGRIATDTYAALAENPAVVATKHIGGPAMEDDIRAVAGRMRVLPVDAAWPALARTHPDEAVACWTGNLADGPEPLLALADAVGRRDWTRADAVAERMRWAQAPMFPGGSLERFMDYSIAIAHARHAGAGLIEPGPVRPPYGDAPPEYLAGGFETGRRWRALRDEFAGALTSPIPSGLVAAALDVALAR